MNKRLATLLLTPIILLTGLSSQAFAGDSKTEEKIDNLGESPTSPDVPDAPEPPQNPDAPDTPDRPDEVKPAEPVEPWFSGSFGTEILGYEVEIWIVNSKALPFGFYDPAGDLGDMPAPGAGRR